MYTAKNLYYKCGFFLFTIIYYRIIAIVNRNNKPLKTYVSVVSKIVSHVLHVTPRLQYSAFQ